MSFIQNRARNSKGWMELHISVVEIIYFRFPRGFEGDELIYAFKNMI
jgi:hypothetical protein